jgi:adenosine 3'-phospho 5'-phosphosulfate transporter B2
VITVGVAVFTLFSKDSTKDGSSVTTISGLILLASYLSFDAFTSNWQGELFKAHKMSSIQMMAGVNLFSVLFTTVALLEQGGFFESIAFMTRHSEFMFHVVILSLCSAGGQLFIFYTINNFGAVVFTIIMTLRQAFAIIISCILFHHPVSVPSMLGILVVFSAIAVRMYCGHQAKKKAAATAVVTPAAPRT